MTCAKENGEPAENKPHEVADRESTLWPPSSPCQWPASLSSATQQSDDILPELRGFQRFLQLGTEVINGSDSTFGGEDWIVGTVSYVGEGAIA